MWRWRCRLGMFGRFLLRRCWGDVVSLLSRFCLSLVRCLLVGGGARLVACAGAVGAAVVGWCQAAAVVVAQLDDHEVAGFDCVNQGLETAFAVVAAGGAAGYGCVDDWDGQGVVEVLAPSWVVLVGRALLFSF